MRSAPVDGFRLAYDRAGAGPPVLLHAWADRLDAFFADVELRRLPGIGRFAPLEAPDAMAEAISERL